MPNRSSQNLCFSLSIPDGVIRLDHAVRQVWAENSHLRAPTHSQIRTWIEAGFVLVDEQIQRSASLLLQAGKYQIRIDEAVIRPPLVASQSCFLPILYEDETLLILNKTSGIPSLPHSPAETHTAVGAAIAHCPKIAEVTDKLEGGLLHRLDNLTSGVLAFAKTRSEYEHLRNIWSSSQVVKTYRAIIESDSDPEVPPLPLTIEIPLGRSPKTSKRIFPASKLKRLRGRPLPALTRIDSASPLPGNRYDLEITLLTGVMHQIRCHLSTLGLPIVGDPIYGRASAKHSRLLLHAWKLRLTKKNGAAIEITAPLPNDWARK